MENQAFEANEVEVVPIRFSALSASRVSRIHNPQEKRKVSWLVYIYFLLLGMGSLLSSNFFFTPAMFWHIRFSTTSNGTEHTATWMQEFWQNSLMVVLLGTISFMSTGESRIHPVRMIIF